MSAAPTALTCHRTTVRPEWVDYNGHMNDAAFANVFSEAIDALMDWLGIDADFRAEHAYTIFTLEMHIRYLAQAYEAQPLAVEVRLIDHDAKRLHVLMTLREANEGTALATGELMLMGIDTTSERPAPFPEIIAERVGILHRQHGYEEWPADAGRAIGIRRG
ncbi:MAG: thioesterase family protein [Halofilum sp. (in: g-proteobacteria)]